MSTATEDGSAAGSSSSKPAGGSYRFGGGGSEGSSAAASGGSANAKTPFSRMNVSVAVIVCMAGLIILWLLVMGGSKKPTDAPPMPSPPPALVRKPFIPHMPEGKGPAFPAPPAMPPRPGMPPVENPVPPSLVRPPHPAARLPMSPKTSDERTVPVALPGSLAPATQGPDLSRRIYSPDDDYLPPPRSDFPEKLPLHVVPLHYDIMIKIVLDANRDQSFMFGDTYYLGKTIVLLRCVKPTQTVYLHAAGFTIKEQQTTLVREEDKTFVGIGKMAINDDLEMLKIETDTPLELNESYTLSIEFAGAIRNVPRGIYKSYFVSDNERIAVVATQFLPTYARWVFPCFDEPSLRTTFDLVVVRPSHYRSFSNMPLSKSEERSRDFVADYFDRTPPMPTHSLGFVIGPYVTAGNAMIKVHGTTQQVRNADYAIQVAPKILQYCQDTFGLNYPLPKLDLVSTPILPAPAMDQWGMITFQDVYLTFRSDDTPFQMKVDSLRVIANKIAQQWMGNLVNMAWWDDMWLKEGISRYITYTAANRADPQTEVSFTILEADTHYAMEADGFNSSAAVSRPLNSPADIRKHLNMVTLSKGAALVRMMAHVVPSNLFRLALTELFKKYSYQSIHPQHLYKEIHIAQKAMYDRVTVNLTTVMREWTYMPGFPVVFVNRSYETNTFSLSQRRFIFGTGPVDNTVWHIPISIVTEDNPDFTATAPKHWFSTRTSALFGAPSKNHWLLLNAQEAYYYKVNYDRNNWLLLVSQLETDHKVIHEFNRAQLIDDALDLARGGQLQYDLAFDVLEYLPKERHHVPWNAALTNFQKLDPVLRHTKIYQKWKRFVNHLLSNQYERLMSEESKDESMQISILRSSVLTLSCDYDHNPCVSFCRRMFENLKTNYDAAYHMVPYSYRPIVFCQAIKHGNQNDFNFLWKHYEMSPNTQERVVLLKALSCTTDLKLLERLLLQLVNKNSGVETTQKAANLLNAISSTSISGSKSVIRFMTDHQDAMFNRFGTLQGLFDSILQTIVDNIRHESELEKLHSIYERTRDVLPSEEEKVQRMIQNAREHIRWTTYFYRDVESWLDKRFVLTHREREHAK
ncbi:aminopeptidase N-like [Dermacentor albipictus]|uniref:aminopeptidase N-like n=1 Tax=Dermacentor albipictus TaxID=60249 RepID=UPI0031FBDBBB